MSDIEKYLKNRKHFPKNIAEINADIMRKAIRDKEERVRKAEEKKKEIMEKRKKAVSFPEANTEKIEEIDHFKCYVTFRKKQTTIRIRMSLAVLYTLVTDIARSLSGGYVDPLRREIERIIRHYPRDRDIKGIASFISDVMVKEIIIKMEELNYIDNASIRYDRILEFLSIRGYCNDKD